MGTKFLPVWNILPPVHVMSNFSIIKLIDCCRSVIQYRQHILPDILHFACTPVKTEKHILDVFIPDFQQTALDHLCRHSFPVDLLIWLCRTYCIQHQLYQLFYRPDFDTIPIASVAFIHCYGVSVKALSPDSALNLSNSIGLKLGL